MLEGVGPNAKLFLWRTSHDGVQAPEVLVLTSEEGSQAGYVIVDAHNGRSFNAASLPDDCKQASVVILIGYMSSWQPTYLPS